ncbi:MAG: DUF2878 domain-containing protein [Methylotenera sp.]|nr:DUF2878 domain-containing protein [Methylotenera sp.]
MLLANFLLFQLAWFACVAGAAYGMPWLGVSVTLMTTAWHLYQSKRAKPEMLLMFGVLLIGASFDQIMLLSELVTYQQHGWSTSLVPVWIMALWLAFASTLNLSLAWMQGRYLMATVFGASGGPLAYFGAQNIGAVTLPGSASYIALSIGWAIITPALLYLAKHINRWHTEHSA